MAVIDSFIGQISEKSIDIGLLKDVILNAIQIKDNLYIEGAPGIGKSSIVQQVVEEINSLLMKTTPESDMFLDKNGNKCCYELIDIRMSLLDSADICGLPDFTTDEFGAKRTKFSLPTIFPSNPKWKGIIFLDEFDQAEPQVMKACYQLIQDRRIHEFSFPKGATFIGAGNGSFAQGYQVDLPQALRNRFTNIKVEGNLDNWIAWAILNNIDSTVISFLKSQHPELYLDKSALDSGDEIFASPRGWAKVSDIMKSNCSDIVKQIHINGRVGYTTGSLFWSYAKKEKKLPDFLDILDGQIDIDDKSLDIFYSCMVGCLTKIVQLKTDEEQRKMWITNLSKSLNKLKKDENVVFAGKLMYQLLSTKDTDNIEFLKILKRIKEAKKSINAY